jgi:hypothetical protein
MKIKVRIITFVTLAAAVSSGCSSSRKDRRENIGFVFDSFTGRDGTLLESHTGEKGATWSKCLVENLDEVLLNGNRIHKDGGNHDAIYFASGIPTSAEYDVSADVYVASNVPMSFSAVCGRMDPNAKSMYLVWYSYTNTSWELNKFDRGAQTQLGRCVLEVIPRKTYKVKLEIRNATKKVFIDGVERISSADNSLVEPGRAGVYFITQATLGGQAVNTGYHIDNFLAVAAGGDTVVSTSGRATESSSARGSAQAGNPLP